MNEWNTVVQSEITEFENIIFIEINKTHTNKCPTFPLIEPGGLQKRKAIVREERDSPGNRKTLRVEGNVQGTGRN